MVRNAQGPMNLIPVSRVICSAAQAARPLDIWLRYSRVQARK